MSIHTSYFGNIKAIEKECHKEVFVSIAGFSPKWFRGYKLPELAPKKWWWKIWHDSFKDNLESEESKAWYTERYKETVLAELDQSDTVRKIVHLENESGCRNVTLLCYETPEKFCHRHLVAEWLNNGKDRDVLARPVLEWRSSKDLDINVAKTLLNAIGLDLRAMIGYPDFWHIVNQSCRDEDPGLMCGDARYIFEQLQAEQNLWVAKIGMNIKNPYYKKSYEELLVRAHLLNPDLSCG